MIENILPPNDKSDKLYKKEKHLFVGYLPAGYPTREDFLRIIKNSEKEGIQIFEIGFPSLNPYSDGEVIQNAHRMIDQSIARDLHFWREVRNSILQPIWIMGYKEDLIKSEMYLELAKENLYDALVVPDLNVLEQLKVQEELSKYGVDVVGFISTEQSKEENNKVLQNFPLIYQKLYSGPTGVANNSNQYLELLQEAKKISSGFIFAGFGIGSCERARELLNSGFDGVIIGTAILSKLIISEQDLYTFIKQMEQTVKGVDESYEVHSHI